MVVGDRSRLSYGIVPDAISLVENMQPFKAPAEPVSRPFNIALLYHDMGSMDARRFFKARMASTYVIQNE